MAELTGSEIIARCLEKEGVKDVFFIMGGPMLLAEASCIKQGIRMIDVRHEQAAAFMCQAYSRLQAGALGLHGGVRAWRDQFDHRHGQRTDRLLPGGGTRRIEPDFPVRPAGIPGDRPGRADARLLQACRSHREPETHSATDQLRLAKGESGKPGPVYVDCPGDMLYQKIDESMVDWSFAGRPLLDSRPMGDPRQVEALVAALAEAKRPLIVSGSGVIWSRAWAEMQAFVEAAGIPFYTTPQGRGVVPDDHEHAYPAMRSAAFRDADLIIVLGTRMNYIIGHASPPRFGPAAKIARIDIDPAEIGTAARYVDIPIVGDCKAVLGQLLRGSRGGSRRTQYSGWRRQLAEGEAAKRAARGANKYAEDGDIHPMRMLEAVRDFAARDAILCVDGQETLNYGRLTMPTFAPGHRLNSGPFGTMGVGLPFGVGAKVACPDKQVIVVHGDGSMGLNAMELDTAIRHRIPILVVISLNGGWTGDPKREKPGRDLGYTRYDKICEALGGYGEYITKAEDITPALERAQKKVDEGMVALVNVRTDYRARFAGVAFSDYST